MSAGQSAEVSPLSASLPVPTTLRRASPDLRASQIDNDDVLVFAVADRHFGLPVRDVREVLPLATLVPVPEAPVQFIGLLRLRGSVLPVVSLRKRLGLPEVPLRVSQRIVVVLAGPT